MYLRVSAVKQLGRSGLYRVSLAHYTPVRLAACNGSVPCTGYPCPPVHQLPAPADQWPAPCHHQCHPVIRLLSKHLLSDTWATDNRDDDLPPRRRDVNMQPVPTCNSSQLSYNCVSAENNDSFFISCDLMTLEAGVKSVTWMGAGSWHHQHSEKESHHKFEGRCLATTMSRENTVL